MTTARPTSTSRLLRTRRASPDETGRGGSVAQASGSQFAGPGPSVVEETSRAGLAAQASGSQFAGPSRREQAKIRRVVQGSSYRRRGRARPVPGSSAPGASAPRRVAAASRPSRSAGRTALARCGDCSVCCPLRLWRGDGGTGRDARPHSCLNAHTAWAQGSGFAISCRRLVHARSRTWIAAWRFSSRPWKA